MGENKFVSYISNLHVQIGTGGALTTTSGSNPHFLLVSNFYAQIFLYFVNPCLTLKLTLKLKLNLITELTTNYYLSMSVEISSSLNIAENE